MGQRSRYLTPRVVSIWRRTSCWCRPQASCCSKIFFFWLSGLLRLGATRPLVAADIPATFEADRAGACHGRFDQEWQRNDLAALAAMKPGERGIGPIFGAARRFVGGAALRSSLYYGLAWVLTFAPPFLLKALVAHLEGSVSYSTRTLWIIVVSVEKRLPFKALCSTHFLRADAQLWICHGAKCASDHTQRRAPDPPKRRPLLTLNGACFVAPGRPPSSSSTR